MPQAIGGKNTKNNTFILCKLSRLRELNAHCLMDTVQPKLSESVHSSPVGRARESEEKNKMLYVGRSLDGTIASISIGSVPV